MQSEKPKTRRVSTVVLGLVIALLGWTFLSGGIRVLQKWGAIGVEYALCGMLWIVGGAAMILGGVWASFSAGRSRPAFVIASRATVVAGATAVIGTLTYVVPCGGPS